jgi:hypothetical protein
MTDEERELQARLEAGETVVLNIRTRGRPGRHDTLWQWAKEAGLAVFIARPGKWGNPFHVDEDGARDTCCDNFVAHYWPHKPSLHREVHTLRGKALGCRCAPERCHGDFLKRQAEES